MSKKRKKKWRKEEVKELVLKYLAEKGKATKYRIKEDLNIPIATVLQAMEDLKNEGLVEWEEKKERGKHDCRLTLKGLIYCLNKRIISLERGKDLFIEFLKEKYPEVLKHLKTVFDSEALNAYLKLELLRLVETIFNRFVPFDDEEEKIQIEILKECNVIEIRTFEPNISPPLISFVKMDGGLVECIPSSIFHTISLLKFRLGYSEETSKELYELAKYLISNNFIVREKCLSDILDSEIASKAKGEPTIRLWIPFGCKNALVEFKLDDKKIKELLNGKITLEGRLIGLSNLNPFDEFYSSLCPIKDESKRNCKECKHIYNNISERLKLLISIPSFKEVIER